MAVVKERPSAFSVAVEHPGALIATATAAASMTAVASLRGVATELDVAVGDLGLDTRALLTMAALWFLVPLLAAVPTLLFNKKLSWKLWAAIVLAGGVAGFLFSAWLRGYASYFVALIFNVYLIALFTFVWWFENRAQSRPAGSTQVLLFAGILAFTLGAAPIIAHQASRDWAASLVKSPARANEGPVPLTFVLPSAVGTVVDARGTESCVLRVGGDVFLGTKAVVVEHEWSRFTVEDCQLDDVPFRG